MVWIVESFINTTAHAGVNSRDADEVDKGEETYEYKIQLNEQNDRTDWL